MSSTGSTPSRYSIASRVRKLSTSRIICRASDSCGRGQRLRKDSLWGSAENRIRDTAISAWRGTLIHCLLAEDDSSEYRRIHTEEITNDSTIVNGVRLMNSSYTILEGDCRVSVTWKSLSVRAEQITYLK